MQKVDHDQSPGTEPQIRLTPIEARGGVISGRVIWVLGVSTALAALLLALLGAFSG